MTDRRAATVATMSDWMRSGRRVWRSREPDGTAVAATKLAMQRAGRIVAVQEERFLLTLDDGRTLLLTAGHGSAVEPRHLETWYREGRRVRVEFEGAPNLDSSVVRDIRVVEAA